MTVSIYKNDIPEDLDLGNEIAVDTETMGLKFGRDRLCLVQIADIKGTVYLVQIEKNQEQLGIYKKPVAAGRASGNLKYSIVPGHSNESIMLFRMKSLDPGIMMPESGRALADEAGINLIKEWIDKL